MRILLTITLTFLLIGLSHQQPVENCSELNPDVVSECYVCKTGFEGV